MFGRNPDPRHHGSRSATRFLDDHHRLGVGMQVGESYPNTGATSWPHVATRYAEGRKARGVKFKSPLRHHQPAHALGTLDQNFALRGVPGEAQIQGREQNGTALGSADSSTAIMSPSSTITFAGLRRTGLLPAWPTAGSVRRGCVRCQPPPSIRDNRGLRARFERGPLLRESFVAVCQRAAGAPGPDRVLVIFVHRDELLARGVEVRGIE